MSLSPGQEIELVVEKPVAGGRMLARYQGQVVFVPGVIPGERILARVDRVDRRLAFARMLGILEPSPDRREVAGDPACGGCLYAHVSYARQLVLKAMLIEDAFRRLGRIPIAEAIGVAPSPERAYRMRARFHARGERIGFYREGTHELCDARDTGHLGEGAVRAVEAAVRCLTSAGCAVSTAVLAENMPADERALHMTLMPGAGLPAGVLEGAVGAAGLTGCLVSDSERTIAVSGVPEVGDALTALTAGRAFTGMLRRHPASFFQANRFLLPQLVGTVLDAVPDDRGVIDLYAGVGLFAVSLAAIGHADVIAVEGDRASVGDLRQNAAPLGGRVRVVTGSVEEFVRQARPVSEGTVIVDPPRTGISRLAMEAVIGLGACRIVYVSCDPATMARDARRLLDGGYRMTSLRAFDLFPNTPHVETVAIFDRDRALARTALRSSAPRARRRSARRTAA